MPWECILQFNDLLTAQDIDPRQVIVMRHRPQERAFRRVLPWLAVEKPDWFNAYQQTQGEKPEKALLNVSYVASFIGHKPGKALFVGLYKIGKSKPLSYDQYWKIPAFLEMRERGMIGFTGSKRESLLWFDMKLMDFHADWKGKLVINWPPPERSWWRRSHRNIFEVFSILEESALAAAMPGWSEIVLTWGELAVLPASWKSALAQWCGIYYIFDKSDGKGYVGAAYGKDNLLGRWLNYSATGHGGNRQLRKREPKNFIFSILQLVAHDTDIENVRDLETSWKIRLHTRISGLNDN